MSVIENIELAEDIFPRREISSILRDLPIGADVDSTPTTSVARGGACVQKENAFFMSLVEYILKGSRLLVCHKASTWKSYLDKNPLEMNRKMITCACLRDYFIKDMLPKIYEYKMPEALKKQFKLLELSDTFERITQGYVYRAIKCNMPLKFDIDYNSINFADIGNKEVELPGINSGQSKDVDAAEVNEHFILETQKSNPLTSQFFVVTDTGTNPRLARPKSPPQLSVENRALLSAVVSHDYELFHNACIENDEIKKRLKKSRALFQKNGRQLIILEPENLQRKVEKMTKLHKCTVQIMNKRF